MRKDDIVDLNHAVDIGGVRQGELQFHYLAHADLHLNPELNAFLGQIHHMAIGDPRSATDPALPIEHDSKDFPFLMHNELFSLYV
jgi:hypothetical protein